MAIEALDLFSGPGGLTLGFKAGGFRPVLSVEIRPEAVETYRTHTPDAKHFEGDIRDLDLTAYRGSAQVIYGGPPCQPFSTGGLRKAHKDERDMIPEFVRAVKIVRPDAFVMENVPGLIVPDRVDYLHGVVGQFQRLGYTVTWRVLNAAYYGVPQKRQRLFVVGMRGRTYRFPRPTHGSEASLLPLVASGTVIGAEPIGEPPNCPVKYAKFPDLRPSPYAGHVYNGGGRPINLSAPCHTILASAGGYKTHWVDTLNIAPEYHAHLLRGGEPREGEVPGARRLTIEESALLQTFPPDVKFAGSRSAQYTQVGDAVPPRLAEHIALALSQQLDRAADSDREFLPPVPLTGRLW
ncbi:MAG: DNA (cytosine-5-)-methyltransferase [Candidatus Polarisedimenticolia bacterium]|nr:DNA cytosine methyltransferase [bacterium]